MALVDPTGLYAVAIQKLVAVVEEEVGKVVYFKSAFTEMVKEFRSWEPYLQGLDKVSDPDPAVNFWLKALQEWMEDLKSLVQDCQAVDQESSLSPWKVFHKRKLSQRIGNTRQDLENLLKKVPVVNMRKLVVQSRNCYLEQQSRNCYLEQPIPEHLVSMAEKLEEILEALISPASHEKWVGIWGQGGSGKTVLAKQVNNSDVLDEWFQQILFLVVGGAGNKEQALQNLCRLVKCEFHEHDPRSVLYNALKGRKVLLIVDDVWDGKLLDALDVVDSSCGSKIFVTTRNRELLVQKHARIFSAGLMQPEASKRLFYNHAFGGAGCPERLRESADKIIVLCKGLPLALAVVGSAMAGKTEVHQWSYAAQTIKQRCLVRDQDMRGMFQYSYEQLSRVEQECFLTMLSWPEDSRVDASMLVAWWRGEDLIGNLSETGWEEAEEILETLVSRSLILKDTARESSALLEDESLRSCGLEFITYGYRLHDVILELGLNHLLKPDSELQEHEKGHLFLSSVTHRQRFLDYAQSDPLKLRKVRKISCIDLLEEITSLEFEEQASQALGMGDFASLKTIIWMSIRSTVIITEAIARVVSKRCSVLKVLMLCQQWYDSQLKPLEPIELTGHQLQTCALGFGPEFEGTIKVELPSSSIRWLQIETGNEYLRLASHKHLENLELLVCEAPNIVHDALLFNFKNFKNLCWLDLRDDDRLIVFPNPAMSKMRFLRCSNVAATTTAHLPKLGLLSARRVQDGGETCIQLLKPGCPNLKYLNLEGWLAMVDSVQPPPSLSALEILSLKNYGTGEFSMFSSWEASKLWGNGLVELGHCLNFCKFHGPNNWQQRLPRFARSLTKVPVIDACDDHGGIHDDSAATGGLAVVRMKEFKAPGIPATFLTHAAPQTLRKLVLSGFTVTSEAQAAALHQLPRLETLRLEIMGRFPQFLFSFPKAFLHLQYLTLRGNFEEFPRIGEGALPQLLNLTIKQLDEKPVTELVIGAGLGNSRLENLKNFIVMNSLPFKLLPVEVLLSPRLETLFFHSCKFFEKLALEPKLEHKIAASSLKYLLIIDCEKMTVEGIPEVFKQMHQNGKLRITSNGIELKHLTAREELG